MIEVKKDFFENAKKQYCTSYFISKLTKKHHDHVVRDIKELINKMSRLKEVEENKEHYNITNYFICKTYKKTGSSFYLLTKKGYILLLMSYTKIDYLKYKIKLLNI